ncbi:hypothetical protein N7456_003965 [Penicillium angulare]|uniref:NACHT domain-containing protein n=1 Tax=Penicillium angulare TaxID=116970 RepID=A0A9W9FVL9_9EURO|nr:hypothetical protein N7456_003965 [Penicillium angulare]
MRRLKHLLNRDKESKDNNSDSAKKLQSKKDEVPHHQEPQNNCPSEIAVSNQNQIPQLEIEKVEKTSSPPQDLWQSAYIQLSEKEHDMLSKPELSAQSGSKGGTNPKKEGIIDKVIQTTKEQYEYYQERGLKIRRSKGDDIDLRKISHTVINAAISFKTVIGAIAAFDPTSHASSAWAVVSLGLTIAKNRSDLRDAFFDSSEYLAETLARYAYIEEKFYHKSEKNEQIGDALVKVYKAVLQYTAEVLATRDAGMGKWMLDSVTEIAKHSLSALKASIKEQDQELHYSIDREQYLHQNEQAERWLVQSDQMIRSLQILIAKFNLPIAEGASYDSYENQHGEKCLPETRTELRRQVTDWAEDFDSKLIFWLNGMAGTGKSTIARTLAQIFKEKGLLGASFFFKKGEADRGNARRFISTITKQLMSHHRQLAPDILKAIENDPDLSTKALGQQFDNLLLQPLLNSKQSETTSIVIVIDALDECENEDDISIILRLLPKLEKSTSFRLRIFLTSRPELPIRLGFEQTQNYQDRILHELPNPVIEHDIRLFLEDRFSKIKTKRRIREEWPTDDTMENLVKMAVPLFIFAATVCRFVGEGIHPERRLKKFLDFQAVTTASQMDQMYQPVLNNLLPFDENIASEEYLEESEEVLEEFRSTVGVIILLAVPMSIESIAGLLKIQPKDISDILDPLHSVISVPNETGASVRILHLSFRNYLVNTDSKFRVDETETHWKIALACFRVMECKLKRNICNLSSYAYLREDIASDLVDQFFSEELRYSCLHWSYHLERSKDRFVEEQTLSFLKKHLFHWLEAMSLISGAADIATLISEVRTCAESNKGSDLSDFLRDANRFILKNAYIINTAPLQIYCSGVAFSPMKSIIRSLFKEDRPKWMHILPMVNDSWGAELQSFEGYSSRVSSVAFSADGQKIASGFANSTVELWDIQTGLEIQSISRSSDVSDEDDENDGYRVKHIVFSPDGKMIAWRCSNGTIKLWDTTTGSAQILGKDSTPLSLTFSLDGQSVIWGASDRTIRLWNKDAGLEIQNIDGFPHDYPITVWAVSPDGKKIALCMSEGQIIKLWDITTSSEVQAFTLEDTTGDFCSIAFSSDWHSMASTNSDVLNIMGFAVKLWNTTTGIQLMSVDVPWSYSSSLALSSDGKRMAASSIDGAVKVWDTTTGSEVQNLNGHLYDVSSVAFSPDGQKIATASDDKAVKVWDVMTNSDTQSLKGHKNSPRPADFFPRGEILAYYSSDDPLRIWNITTGLEIQTFPDQVQSIFFSQDGQTVASGSEDGTVRLWDITTGLLLQTLSGHSEPVISMVFCSDGQKLVSISDEGVIKLWNTTTGSEIKSHEVSSSVQPDGLALSLTPDEHILLVVLLYESAEVWTFTANLEVQKTRILEGHINRINLITISPNGKMVALRAFDWVIRIWDILSGKEIDIPSDENRSTSSMVFSQDGRQIAVCQWGGTVKLWTIMSGAEMGNLDHAGCLISTVFSPDSPQNSQKLPEFQISVEDGWVLLKRERLLWLPSNYRDMECVEMRYDSIYLGYEDGRAIMIGLYAPED